MEHSHTAREAPVGSDSRTRSGTREWCRNSLTQVVLQRDAVLVDEEGCHAGLSVFRGISEDRETSGHGSVNEVVLRCAMRLRPLACEHAEVITVLGLRFLRRAGITFACGELGQRTERAA